MVPMFAKTMDTAADDLKEGDLGIKREDQIIPALIFMDDVGSMAEGYKQQEKTLRAIDNFGVKHKIEWGQDKCKVMEIGKHKEKKIEWKLGEKTIENCKSYKYLGEIITRDGKNDENLKARYGKNDENLKARYNKVRSTVKAINTCGKGRIMRRIEVEVLITLHDAVTLPTLLYN